MVMMIRFMLLLVVAVVLELVEVIGQQSYVNNHQLDCYNHFNSTDGFVCRHYDTVNDIGRCSSFLTFRSIPPYDSPVSIAYLLHSDPALVAAANNVSDVDRIPSDRLILVPVNCSCTGHRFYQHNASYSLKTTYETYFTVANNTYQGLTTCQAMMAQNPSLGDRNLSVGMSLQIPLRCACPSPNQTAFGVKYLLSYLVTWHDDISSIGRRFGVDSQSLLDANMLSSADIIYPFTPLLVPLTAEPSSSIGLNQSPNSPPPPPPSSLPPPDEAKTNSKKWVFVGMGAGVAAVMLSTLTFCFLRRRRNTTKQNDAKYGNEINPNPNSSAAATTSPWSDREYYTAPLADSGADSKSTWSVSSGRIRSAVESLSLYDIEEVRRATDSFSQANKIQGSVYRGRFKGDDAAVKVMKGDVSSEINILKHINHSNVIRLSGFCMHEGNTYLVYEYAERGSLNQCLQRQLHPSNSSHSAAALTWKQRVEIAHDVVDALNYLHNFADPPYIHKNLKSSNILLDGNLRAKVSNFGLARRAGDGNVEEGFLQLTRHVVGTQGYLAPEYIDNGVITPKMDVFAFGVVILELLSGKEAATTHKNNCNNEELLFNSITRVLQGDNVREKLRGFMDPALTQADYPLDLAFSMAQLAKACVAPDLNSRPNVRQVFITVSKIRSSTRDWDPSDELQRSPSLTDHAR